MKFQPGNSIGEVTRFKPGQSGNPRGRPRGRSRKKPLRDAFRRLLNEMVADDQSVADKLARMALAKALGQDRDAIGWARFIQATLEGKAVEVEEDDDDGRT